MKEKLYTMISKNYLRSPVIEKLLKNICAEIREVQKLHKQDISQEMSSRLKDLEQRLRLTMIIVMELWLIDAPLEIEQLFTQKTEPVLGIFRGKETTVAGYIVAEIDNLMFSKKTNYSKIIQFESSDFSDEKMNKIIISTAALLRLMTSNVGEILFSCSGFNHNYPNEFIIDKRHL